MSNVKTIKEKALSELGKAIQTAWADPNATQENVIAIPANTSITKNGVKITIGAVSERHQRAKGHKSPRITQTANMTVQNESRISFPLKLTYEFTINADGTPKWPEEPEVSVGKPGMLEIAQEIEAIKAATQLISDSGVNVRLPREQPSYGGKSKSDQKFRLALGDD